jgi:hypothetical protein
VAAFLFAAVAVENARLFQILHDGFQELPGDPLFRGDFIHGHRLAPMPARQK